MSSQLIRQDLVPIGAGYLILMIILAVGLVLQRRRAASSTGTGRRAGPRRGWAALAAQVARDVAGGYLVLAAIVILYYYGVAKVAGNFLASAFTGTALLLAISLPLFAIASWLSERRRRSGERQAGQERGKAGG